jgi:LmbE family N-acetylglucosaminyl deacetylase
MRNFLLVFLTCCQLMLGFGQNVYSQPPPTWTSADMYQGLQKLNVLGSVLYIAAHPDDENTRLIAYLSKDRLYRTGYLSLTRGDGGQNLIGDEQGIELGLIRTQELLSARRIDGGEQFFTRAFDFGYSKTPDETFTKWDREKIVSDVVWVIRKFQPDVIITRFPTTGEGGHGHHTASAILANEAFTAAADPRRFPEQLNYVKPWQAKRIVWNTFNFGGTNTQREDQLKIDVGGYNPLLGKSYGEIAAESRSQHKSQGFGVPGSRGEALEYFATTGGPAPKNDLMEGVDLSWNKIKGGAAVSKMIAKLSSSFDLLHPESSVEGLVKLYQLIDGLKDNYWKTQKLKEVKELIAQCSGLFIDATTSEQFAVQTDSIRISFSLNNRLGVDAVLKKISVDGTDSSFSIALTRNRNLNIGKPFYVPSSKPVSQPYWLKDKMEEGYFNVSNQQKIGQPDIDPAYVADITVSIDGVDFSFARAVKYKFTDPVRGEIYWPVAVLPPYTLKLIPEFIIAGQPGGVKSNYEKRFTSYKNRNLILTANRSLQEKKEAIEDSMVLNKGETRTVPVQKVYDIDPSFDPNQPGKALVNLTLDDEFIDRRTNEGLKDIVSIRHDHIPAITWFKPSKVVTRVFSYATQGKKIGYIVGAGDKVPDALEQMGYEVTLLTDKELSRNNLGQFDAIITGVRAYNTNEWMNNYYDKLMKYVNDGGNLVVQYNTSSNIGPVRAKMGPYDFTISRTRITDENAAVTFLKPEHPVLNFPNKILPDDFKNWVQERSIYHAANWDKTRFETIFSMHDPGENPDEGSLIIAGYGKGYFTYTGLVFFRELPAGVPGAYKLLANIIALNRKKAF